MPPKPYNFPSFPPLFSIRGKMDPSGDCGTRPSLPTTRLPLADSYATASKRLPKITRHQDGSDSLEVPPKLSRLLLDYNSSCDEECPYLSAPISYSPERKDRDSSRPSIKEADEIARTKPSMKEADHLSSSSHESAPMKGLESQPYKSQVEQSMDKQTSSISPGHAISQTQECSPPLLGVIKAEENEFSSHTFHDEVSSQCPSSGSSLLRLRRNLYSSGRLRRNPYSSGKPAAKGFDICQSKSRKDDGVLCHLDSAEQNNGFKHLLHNMILRPGMVLLRNFLTDREQIDIIKKCRELGLGAGGFHQPGYNDGAKLRLQMMCLGLYWDPQTKKYFKKQPSNGCLPPRIPSSFIAMAKRSISKSQELLMAKCYPINVEDALPGASPDICIVNFYTTSGRLGLHQDLDESRASLLRGLPVVSFSIGDSAEFVYGDGRDLKKAESVELKSGDVLVFGGPSRNVFHGVASIIPFSAPPFLSKETQLRPGRLNLTFRQY